MKISISEKPTYCMTPIIWHSGLEKAMMERVKRLISTGFGDEELAHQDF